MLVNVFCNVSDCDLEKEVLKIFEDVAYPFQASNIEACHRISKKIKAIVKFFRRKDYQKVLNVKKEENI